VTERSALITIAKSVAIWLVILVLAILNGVFRETVLLPNLSTRIAFVVSGILLSLLIVIVALAFSRWLVLTTPSRCFRIGALWLTLTLVFEFGFGLFVQDKALSELLDAYTFKDANIWPVVLLVTLFAPLLAGRIRRPRALRRDHTA